MKKIGVLSDTHGFLDEKIWKYFADVDEIWHAGDIGSVEVLDSLKAFKPTKAVFGNIDDYQIRRETPEFLSFRVEECNILITHIAGKPGKYAQPLYVRLQDEKPDILVCGHSHILLVKTDPFHKMLWINPGACGNKGFHSVKTLLRFEINGKKPQNMQVIELGKR
jgi:putative phosphoesterase